MADSLLNLNSPIVKPEEVQPFTPPTISPLPQEQPIQNVQAQYVTPEARVSQQLASLLKVDSPYIQAARSGAKEQANQLGLLSSSMAAGAGQRAAIQSALPIAQAEAGMYADIAKQAQVGQQARELSKIQAQNQAELEAAGQSMLAEREKYTKGIDLATSQLSNQVNLQKIAADLSINVDQLQQNERKMMVDTVNNIQSNYSQTVATIQNSTTLGNRETKSNALNSLEVYTKNMYELAAKIYNQPDLKWKTITWS